MYTHLYINRSDATRVFDELGNKPLEEGEYGVVTRATLDLHFAEFSQTYIEPLDATMEQVGRQKDMFVLKFREYLDEVPQLLADMNVLVYEAEIVRYQSAPTSARAGRYKIPAFGFAAIVEHVPATKSVQMGNSVGLETMKGVYAHNITVTAPTLAMAQHFNESLSVGDLNKALVSAFE